MVFFADILTVRIFSNETINNEKNEPRDVKFIPMNKWTQVGSVSQRVVLSILG